MDNLTRILTVIYFVLLFNYGTFASKNDTTLINKSTPTNATVTDNSTVTNSSEPEKPKHPRIIIVGAGASGIAAASKLFEVGFKDVTIIEAENRIGGRIFTTKFGDYVVDMGGQWVHGQKGNVVYELAAPLGLLDATDNRYYGVELKFIDSAGNPLDRETEVIFKDFYFDNNGGFYGPGNITDYESVGDLSNKIFDLTFQNNSKVYKEKKKYIAHFESFRISLQCAKTWHELSLEDGGYKPTEGDQNTNWKTRGYSTILDILMKKFPDPAKELPVKKNTILNSTVLAIDYIGNSEGPPVLVTTTNGQLYKADHVIVTVSLGVLKEKHKSLFIPSLPDDKVRAIENLGYGNVVKLYVLFDKPFWNLGENRSLYFQFLWNDVDRQEIESDPERIWLLGPPGAITVAHKPNLLELVVTGKHAKDLDQLSDEQVFNHTKELLHRFFAKTFKLTKPIKITKSRWYSNPNFRGTYSYRSVDAQKEQVYPSMLEEPLDPQNLTILFAGEATSTTRFSTVDGAIGTGWKVADRLINHYKNKLPFDN